MINQHINNFFSTLALMFISFQTVAWGWQQFWGHFVPQNSALVGWMAIAQTVWLMLLRIFLVQDIAVKKTDDMLNIVVIFGFFAVLMHQFNRLFVHYVGLLPWWQQFLPLSFGITLSLALVEVARNSKYQALVWRALFFVALLTWGWQSLHTGVVKESATLQTQSNIGSGSASASASASARPPHTLQTIVQDAAGLPTPAPSSKEPPLVHIKTPHFEVNIDQYGQLSQWALLDYHSSVANSQPVMTLYSESDRQLIAQSGITSADIEALNPRYQTAHSHYEIDGNASSLEVPLRWRHPHRNIEILKVYRFFPKDYIVEVEHRVLNHSAEPWTFRLFLQFKRSSTHAPSGWFGKSVQEEDPPAISSAQRPFEKLPFKQWTKRPFSRWITDGWMAMRQPYFVSAWLPQTQEAYHYLTRIQDQRYYLTSLSQPVTVMPGTTQVLKARLFSGPEILALLRKTAKHLDLSIDFGWLWPMSGAVFTVLKVLYSWTASWGWSIVLLAVLLKLLLAPLWWRQQQMDAKLEKIRQKFSSHAVQNSEQEMLEWIKLLQKEKLSPLMAYGLKLAVPVLQLIVMLSGYYVLLDAIELRHATFLGWIPDLTSADPWFILPILVSLSAFLDTRTRSNAQPVGLVGNLMILVIPGLFFMRLPAGLALYWATSSLTTVLLWGVVELWRKYGRSWTPLLR